MGINIEQVFQSQLDNQFAVGRTTVKERIGKLDALNKAVTETYRKEITDALYKDMKKAKAEVDLTEIYVVTTEIKHAKRELRAWMSKHRVPTPLPLLGSSSWIRYEPKGVCLIISPWNFPLNLTFGPLVSAIAAGNTVILKPSEYTVHTSAIMAKIISDLFPSNEIAVFQGGIDVATRLLALPFNHMFFTGSSEVGKIVMKAASKHLSSVTLELGGKSPTIVDKSANLSVAAKRIAWGKFLNNGQICIAPDYVLVHSDVAEEFTEKLKTSIKKLYSDQPQSEPSYNRMVNEKHLERVGSYLDDSIEKGGKIEIGGKRIVSEENYFSPTVVSNVSGESKLMTEEIFGPVLPITTFDNLAEAIEIVNSKERPLALYIYSRSKSNINSILQNTRAGGSCINTNAIHFFNMNLPFGGSNNSGIGKSHGFYGFESFSNARGIYKQNIPGALELLMPPYSRLKEKIIELTIKWL